MMSAFERKITSRSVANWLRSIKKNPSVRSRYRLVRLLSYARIETVKTVIANATIAMCSKASPQSMEAAGVVPTSMPAPKEFSCKKIIRSHNSLRNI